MVKISVDGVFARLDEPAVAEGIRLSEQGRSEQCTRPLAASPKLHGLLLVLSMEGCKKETVDRSQGKRRPG